MPVVPNYGDYISELLRINNLYRVIIKYASKEYTPKKSSAGNYKDKDLIDWELTRAAAASKGGQKKRI